MDSIITEILPPFQAPSKDALLVVFSDDATHTADTGAADYLVRCAKYARRHSIHLVSGLLVHERNLCLFLLDPNGRIACRQPAVHLSMPYAGLLERGNKVEVAHTPLGNLYLCVDADICHQQTVRAAALKGADAVISVQHTDPSEDTPERLMCTAWNAAQSNNLYVVSLSGSSCSVACPAPLTRGADGYLVRQRPLGAPVRFGLNMPRLDEIRSHFELMEHINTQLILHYADELRRYPSC